MSGFEVAGLVLGAIPLVLAAFEIYSDAFSKVEKWKRYAREVGRIGRSLRLEQARLESICEKMLNGLVPVTDIEAMMKDPRGPLWKAKGLHEKMAIRLWKSGKDIMAAIEDINSAINEIKIKLNLVGGEASLCHLNTVLIYVIFRLWREKTNVNQVQWDEKHIKQQFRRAKFTLKSDTYEEQIDRIKNGVTSIENHLSANIELELPRRRRSQLQSHQTIREVASSLCRALRSAFVCQCPESHVSVLPTAYPKENFIPDMLNLQHVVPTNTMSSQTVEFALRKASDILLPGPQDEETLVPKSVFHIAVRYQVQLPDRQSRTLRDGLIVRPVIKSNNPSTAVPKPCDMSTAASTNKSIRFSGLTLSSIAVECHPIGTASAVSTLVQDAARIPKILSLPGPTAAQDPARLVDLCRTIRAPSPSQRPESAYGYIYDDISTKPLRYELFPTNIVKEDIDTISLGTILSECRAHQRTLSLETRLYLAVVLASSFLQLSGTGWMPDVVTHHDVFFAKRDGSVSYREPIITKPFTESRKSEEKPCDSALPYNAPLFSLGILLIEIILRTPFYELMGTEGLQRDSSHGIAKQLMDFEAAESLLNRVGSNGDEAYKHAVRCCIENEYRNQGLEDKEVQGHLYTRVFERLEQSLEALEHF